MSLVHNSKWKREYSDGSYEHNSDSYDGHSTEREVSYEYAQRDGPHEESDSDQDKYNISDEDNFEDAEVYHEGHSYRHPYESESTETLLKHFKHQQTSEYVDSDPGSISHEKPRDKQKHEERHKPIKPSRKCSKKSKKTVYIYKQPPIIVKPKPTNVYIKSKPILVQPPPLVVHHAAPKPCNPIIRYQPPNIKVKPVIVKISKPKKTTTTTTTPCPSTTTKKPCRKCRRKPTKKCNRCSSRKTASQRLQRPRENKVYYEQYRPEQPQFGVLT